MERIFVLADVLFPAVLEKCCGLVFAISKQFHNCHGLVWPGSMLNDTLFKDFEAIFYGI